MICLYNNLGNTHITTKKTNTTSACNKREYPEGFLNNLYANVAYENSLTAP